MLWQPVCWPRFFPPEIWRARPLKNYCFELHENGAVISCNFTADITFGQTKKHFYPQAETSRHISNHSSIFYHGYGIFIFHISWLVPAFKAFSYHWCPYFVVHMKTTNMRFIRSVFFCPFVTHALLLFVLYICTVPVQSQKHHRKSLTYWSSNEFCYFSFLFLEIKKVTPDDKSWLNLIMYWMTGVLCNERKTIAASDKKVTTVQLSFWPPDACYHLTCTLVQRAKIQCFLSSRWVNQEIVEKSA